MLLWTAVLAAFGAIVVVGLIFVVWAMAQKAGYPYWIPWLGTLNILAVADVACYMVIRWLYVRRRFDAEYRDPTQFM